jgi:hypothetical protein
MFTPIAESIKETLDKRGRLQLKVDPEGGRVDPDFKHVPHIISYLNNKQGIGVPRSLFSCKITHTNTMCIMSAVHVRVNKAYVMDEAALHMFLGWLCFEAQFWARNAHKERLMIETCLPHCTEHFMTHDYDIRQYWSKGAEKGYRGLKRVMDA